MKTSYIIVVTNKDGTSCTSAFDSEEKFMWQLALDEELFYDDKIIGLTTSINTEYNRYSVDEEEE